jgi:hypothetical protein
MVKLLPVIPVIVVLALFVALWRPWNRRGS